MMELITYYFAVKNLSELYSSQWLRSKKETIINGDNNFQNALDDTLNYQNNERDPQKISKLKPYINKYNQEGKEFPAGPKDWKKFERNNETIALNILPHNILLYCTTQYKTNKGCIQIRI